MKPQISIVIPHYNDVETLKGTLDSLYATIDVKSFEVIVIDDGSVDKLPGYNRPNFTYLSLPFNSGVGNAFDVGVRVARSANIILMGADIRFEDNGWCSRMLSVLSKHPKALISTECGSTSNDKTSYFGADVIFMIENKDLGPKHPRKNILEYKSILEGKWRPRTGRGVYSVPCLMGAFYGVTKDWYTKIRGFELHYKWGVLEPYISLKSWLLGGEVLVDSNNKTLHIFNRKPQRNADWSALSYNQLIIAGCVFGIYGMKYAKYLIDGGTEFANRGADMRMERIEAVNQLAVYLQNNAVMEPEQLEELMVDMSYHYNKESVKYKNPVLGK